MHPSGGASAAPGRVGNSAGGGRPAQAPWTPPWHRPAGSARAGGPAWLKEHVTAPRSWASTIARAEIRLHDLRDQPGPHQGAERGPTDPPATPKSGGTPPTSTRGGSAPTGTTGSWRPGATPLPTRLGADPANTPLASLSPPTSPARGRWPSRAPCLTEGGGRLPPPTIRHPTTMGPHGGRRSHPTPPASGLRGSPLARRRWSTRCPYSGSGTACAREGQTPGTRSGTSEPPRATVTPYCTRRTGRRPRTPSRSTRPRTLATPNSLSRA